MGTSDGLGRDADDHHVWGQRSVERGRAPSPSLLGAHTIDLLPRSPPNPRACQVEPFAALSVFSRFGATLMLASLYWAGRGTLATALGVLPDAAMAVLTVFALHRVRGRASRSGISGFGLGRQPPPLKEE